MMADRDLLTGLTDHRLLLQRPEDVAARAQFGDRVALHLIDLDCFAEINARLRFIASAAQP